MIEAIDYDDKIQQQYGHDNYVFDQVIDANGCAIIPGEAIIAQAKIQTKDNSVSTSRFFFLELRTGFVDAHTHPVWAGERVHEFAMKVRIFIWFTISVIRFEVPIKKIVRTEK